MLTFIISIGLLIVAYFTYGKFVERFFGASSTIATPVKRLADGVDYHELKPWRIFVIQFLNIAGLGPIFGARSGLRSDGLHMDRNRLYFHGSDSRLFFRHAFYPPRRNKPT